MPEQDSPREKPPVPEKEFSRQVSRKEARKLKARDRKGQEVWFGLGMFGPHRLVGGLARPGRSPPGRLDRPHLAQRYSWTLMLLLGGIILGSLNAWYWVGQEHKKNRKGPIGGTAMELSLDQWVIWQRGPVLLNATIPLHLAGDGAACPMLLDGDPPAFHWRKNFSLAKSAGGPGGGAHTGADSPDQPTRSRPVPAVHRHPVRLHFGLPIF